MFEHGRKPIRRIEWRRKGSQPMADDDKQPVGSDLAAESVEMLKAVVDGETYDKVAARFGVTRTAVERRIKAVALELSRSVGIEGLNDEKVSSFDRTAEAPPRFHPLGIGRFRASQALWVTRRTHRLTGRTGASVGVGQGSQPPFLARSGVVLHVVRHRRAASWRLLASKCGTT